MHRIASRVISVYLTTEKDSREAAVEVKRFAKSFVSEGTSGIIRMLKRMIDSVSIEEQHFPALKKLLIDFLSSLEATEVVACTISLLDTFERLEDLKQWCTKEWDTTFADKVAGSAPSAQPLSIAARRCGTLTPVPREVMDIVMSFIPLQNLKTIENVGPVLDTAARDAKFFAKFNEKEGEFEQQLQSSRAMGLLEMFAEDVVLSTLKTTKGNVEHCIALLFGEGRR